jgi:glyoxalase family protein
MKLQGLHHITMITGDAQRNVDFYADLLGLRLVKKTVNFDQPDAYHLYYGDEQGSPGTLLTWFEFADAAPGRAGAGMVHLIQLGVASERALEFWEKRVGDAGHTTESGSGSLRFRDYDGLAFELIVADGDDPALRPVHPQIPAEHAILRVAGARAYAQPDASVSLLTDTLGFKAEPDGYGVQGERRHFHWAYDPPPDLPGQQGAGTVHHIAWASNDAEHPRWRARVVETGARVTDVIDRDYFYSIYFREPSHVLFEIATLSPGFAIDEDPARLGETLRLPRQHEHLRERLERLLTPLTNPRAAAHGEIRT